jgi:hypothetical protein
MVRDNLKRNAIILLNLKQIGKHIKKPEMKPTLYCMRQTKMGYYSK